MSSLPIRWLAACAIAASAAFAQDMEFRVFPQQIEGPRTPAEFREWLAAVKAWRTERRVRMGYDDSIYDRLELRWARHNFMQPQMMAEERYFYDPQSMQYTVDRYLDDLDKRYGGIDSVLIWPVYPNIGIDNRNQFDMLRSLPGGIAGVKKMVADFHRRGVRVFFPTMAWDRGTRDEGVPDWVAVARLMKDTGADGINGDTYRGVPRAFFEASLDAGRPLLIEPEVGVESDEQLAWNLQSWGYWSEHPFAPPISRYKWLEPRHMVNVCRRWERDKTEDLQQAFFNGVGYETWENIWGIWNGIPPRAAESIRRIAKIERKFAALLVSDGWEPHTPVLKYGLFASRFPGGDAMLWTFVNRNEYALSGRQIEIAHRDGARYYDLWNGVELRPVIESGRAVLSFPVEPHGFGAVLATRNPAGVAGLDAFVAEMKTLAATPLMSLSNEWKFLPQRMTETAPTTPVASAPEGMVKIPAAESFVYEVGGVEIEGGNAVGVGVQYQWEDSPRKYHRHQMKIGAFYIDKFPVTNAQFKRFLDASKYEPGDKQHFLNDWKNGSYPPGWENRPVTWVSLEDARAYAAWAGKRLPHGWEWQYAAQGTDGRLYPWGNEWDLSAVAEPDKGRNMRPPTEVSAHPKGASPFGVMDLVGNVWQWTDEFVDDHTRTATLRGGSYYQPQGSHWYFPQAYKLNQHGKYLLMGPGKDRAGTLGFRCVADAR